jgi:mRNA interferase MazF
VNARRGDIWLVDFGEPTGREQGGRRPGVIVSADRLNDGPAGIAIVVPCTTTMRDLPSHIEIQSETSGLDEVSYAKCEDVKSVSEQRLVARLGAVDTEKSVSERRLIGRLGSATVPELFDIARALRFLLEL